MEEIRAAWIAGVFEGEGSIGRSRVGRPILTVMMTDEDVIRRLHEWSGVGNVGRPRVLPSGKLAWRWHVGAQDDAVRMLRLMRPYLGLRRCARVAEILAENDLLGPKRGTASTCGYGHELTPDNLRMVEGRRRCLKCQARRQREYRKRGSR